MLLQLQQAAQFSPPTPQANTSCLRQSHASHMWHKALVHQCCCSVNASCWCTALAPARLGWLRGISEWGECRREGRRKWWRLTRRYADPERGSGVWMQLLGIISLMMAAQSMLPLFPPALVRAGVGEVGTRGLGPFIRLCSRTCESCPMVEGDCWLSDCWHLGRDQKCNL